MKINHTFYLFLILLFYPSFSNAALPTIDDSSSTLTANQGAALYLPVTIHIPDNTYIYGNPKGPGTGKALEVSLASSPSIKAEPVLIDRPVHYVPADDQFVLIYRDHVTLAVPITLIAGTSGELSLDIKGLMCSDRSCTPFALKKTFSIAASENKPDPALTKFPAAMIPLGQSAETRTEETIPDSGTDKILPTEISFSPVFVSRGVLGILPALLFGFLAGLILNVMPCVLPVLALKVLGIVRNSGTRRLIIANGLSYTAGILCSFALLAFLVITIGFRWGAFFQQTGFLIVIIFVLFAFSLSLFGIYDIPLPGFISRSASFGSRIPVVDSFSKGFLAAVLATPCSGPLLGAVLAWSLMQPAPVILAVFLSIGLGLSAPYLIISLFPSLVSFIPKPGEWTVLFERLMGFLLAGSVIYFLSILSRFYFIPVAAMLCLSAFGFWQFGRWGNLTCSVSSRRISFAVLILILAASLAFPLSISPESKTITEHRAYSFSSLQAESDAGRLSIVVFTADWCPNCILVEKTVLESKTIRTLLKNKHINLFYADITNSGTEGEVLLKKLGGSAIPFLAVFPAGSLIHPVCLRDIYTKADLAAAISTAEK